MRQVGRAYLRFFSFGRDEGDMIDDEPDFADYDDLDDPEDFADAAEQEDRQEQNEENALHFQDGERTIVTGDSSAAATKKTTSNKDKKIPNDKRTTTPYMTKYERARVLGTRALQIRWA